MNDNIPHRNGNHRNDFNLDPVELVLSHLKSYKRSGSGFTSRCPAHNDKRCSFSVRRRPDGSAAIKCFTGCSFDSLLAALGIEARDLYPQNGNGQRPGDWDIVRTYSYPDGRRHVRHRNKVFQWCAPVGDDLWRWGLSSGWYEQWEDGDWRRIKEGDDPTAQPRDRSRWFDAHTERSLYHEERIRALEPGSLVLYVEGEKDVETAESLGFVATTAGGAQDWRAEFASLFANLDLVIIPDNDRAGEIAAAKVAADCDEPAARVRVCRLPGLPEKGDLTDWKNVGGFADALLREIQDCEDWQPDIARDDRAEQALAEARAAIESSPRRSEDIDPPLSADSQIDKNLRGLARRTTRVVRMVFLIMKALGFEGNHHRLINSLLAYSQGLKQSQLAYFITTHLKIHKQYAKESPGLSDAKERSKAAMVGRDTKALCDEQDALGCTVVDYIPGTMHLDSGQGYGSRYRLQILRYALIAINLAEGIKDQFERQHQADEAAARAVAEMMPRREPVIRESNGSKPASVKIRTDRADDPVEVFREAINRLVDEEIERGADAETLTEKIDQLTRRFNEIASEALSRGVIEIKEREAETGQQRLEFEQSHVYKDVDIGEGESDSESLARDSEIEGERSQEEVGFEQSYVYKDVDIGNSDLDLKNQSGDKESDDGKSQQNLDLEQSHVYKDVDIGFDDQNRGNHTGDVDVYIDYANQE